MSVTITPTIPFNYDETYKFIEKKFQDAGYDTQEGSNSMQLVSAMSYLTSMLNANTAVNINETLLPLARKRRMVLRNARTLGYEVAHVQSYQYKLKLRFDQPHPTNQNGVHVIKNNTSFIAGDKTYWYRGNTIENIVVDTPYDPETGLGGTYREITVIEGDLKLYSQEKTLRLHIGEVWDEKLKDYVAQRYLDIPFTNVEQDGIEMFITYYDAEGILQHEAWTQSKQFMIDADTELNKEFVRVDNIDYGTPRVLFKIGDVGKDLRIGSIVSLNILISSGSKGAMTELPVPSELDAVVTEYQVTIQGSDEESIESIKQNAPIFHNTANRLVTISDYKVFSHRQQAVRYADVWDGQDEWPNVAGNVWFSFIPSTVSREVTRDSEYQWTLKNLENDNWFLIDGEIENIFNNLDEFRIPTLIYNHRHPIYMDFEYDVKVAKYSVRSSIAEVNEKMFTVVDEYFKRESSDTVLTEDSDAVEVFRHEYFHSNLIKRVDNELTDVTGVDITLKTSIPLTQKHIITEKFELITYDEGLVTEYQVPHYWKEARLHLGVPFEGVFNPDRTVIFDNIPCIDTENFIGTDTLWTDGTTFTYDSEARMTAYNIKLGNVVVGQYRVFNNVVSNIEIILYIHDDRDPSVANGMYTEGLPQSEFTGHDNLRINIKYLSNNLPVARNTMPRLKRVTFS